MCKPLSLKNVAKILETFWLGESLSVKFTEKVIKEVATSKYVL